MAGIGPARSAAEHEQMAGERIVPQHALYQHGEPVDALAHIYVAQGQAYFHAWRKQCHDTAPAFTLTKWQRNQEANLTGYFRRVRIDDLDRA